LTTPEDNGIFINPSSSSKLQAEEALRPPKEIVTVMAYVFSQSFNAAPGSLKWWEELETEKEQMDPEALVVQGLAEAGEPMRVFEQQATVRGSLLFLLQWLDALPEPIIDKACVKQFTTDKNSMLNMITTNTNFLQAIEPLPRSVLVCFGALLGQLTARHLLDGKSAADPVVEKFAQGLTHKADLIDETKAMLNKLGNDSSRATSRVQFPPIKALNAAGCIKGNISTTV